MPHRATREHPGQSGGRRSKGGAWVRVFIVIFIKRNERGRVIKVDRFRIG